MYHSLNSSWKTSSGKACFNKHSLEGSPMPMNPILFENLNAKASQKAALKTNGAAGLSGLDAHSWRRLCSSFKSSNDLCTALACVGRPSQSLCCMQIDSNTDKCPGVWHWGGSQINKHLSYSYPIETAHPGCSQSPSGLCQPRKWLWGSFCPRTFKLMDIPI